MEEFNVYIEKAGTMVIDFAPKLALALVVLWIGFKIVNKLASLLGKALAKAGISENIRPFLTSILGISLKVLIIFSVAGIIGIETASFVAVLAAAGFAVGLALQGSLSNFAAGIIILIFKPYKVDDWIEVQDKFGKVEEIQIFNTTIVTPGRKTLIIPNGQVVESIVTNYSKKGHIRMELQITMPYEESFPKVKQIIFDTLKTIPKVLQDPEPEVGIETYESHSLVVAVRPYVRPDDFWEVTFEAYEKIKAAFYQHKIKVAYSEGVELGVIGE
jgi:small conductance mechanosensitive channel